MSGDPGEAWVRRFERAGWAGRLGLLVGGASRVAATVAERALDRAATIAVEAHDAFRKELDPNVSDARILEEHDRAVRDGAPTSGKSSPPGA